MKTIETVSCTIYLLKHSNRFITCTHIYITPETVPLNAPECSIQSQYLVGCKHRASEGVFYIGGFGCVLCLFIEPVKVFYLRVYVCIVEYRIGAYLDTCRNIKNTYGTKYGLKHIHVHITQYGSTAYIGGWLWFISIKTILKENSDLTFSLKLFPFQVTSMSRTYPQKLIQQK